MANNHGDRKYPKDLVVGPLPNGLFITCKQGSSYISKVACEGHLGYSLVLFAFLLLGG